MLQQATVLHHASHSKPRKPQVDKYAVYNQAAEETRTAKINGYAAHTKQVSIYRTVFSYQHFNPFTSEMINLKIEFSSQRTVQNKPITVITVKETHVYTKGEMVKTIDSRLKVHRGYVLGMLKGGLNISFCKSEKDARRLSNLDGTVVLIKNEGNAVQWGVVKEAEK